MEAVDGCGSAASFFWREMNGSRAEDGLRSTVHPAAVPAGGRGEYLRASSHTFRMLGPEISPALLACRQSSSPGRRCSPVSVQRYGNAGTEARRISPRQLTAPAYTFRMLGRRFSPALRTRRRSEAGTEGAESISAPARNAPAVYFCSTTNGNTRLRRRLVNT
jgi:hypothetical protein